MTELLGSESGPFLGMTVALFGCAAFLSGQAIAQSWRPAWQILPTALLIAAADRFLLYALFSAELASTSGFLSNPRTQDGAAISLALRAQRAL